MNQIDRMFAGQLYDPFRVDNPWAATRKAVKEFNDSNFWEDPAPLQRLTKRFLSVGKDVVLTPPFYCDHGNRIRIGDYFYANTGLTILDEHYVTIGHHVFFGPHVSIYTAAHPIDAQVRNTGLEYAKPVTIGDNVWIGGNVVINPGVTIGCNVVIGSGSVVTKDIPDNVIAVGNPCKILRPITEADGENWSGQLQAYLADLDCR